VIRFMTVSPSMRRRTLAPFNLLSGVHRRKGPIFQIFSMRPGVAQKEARSRAASGTPNLWDETR
jgi:hypothetical protein